MRVRIIFTIVTFISILYLSCGAENFQQGKKLYDFHCGNCHMEQGEGLGKLIPPLANSDYLKQHQNEIACLIRNGISDTIVVNGIEYDIPMEGIKNLSNAEIGNIINFINQAWGNNIAFKSPVEVDRELENCE